VEKDRRQRAYRDLLTLKLNSSQLEIHGFSFSVLFIEQIRSRL
jgi:hypothetical protein